MKRANYGQSVDLDKRQVRYVSVSQIQTFDVGTYGGCPRAWFFERILGRERPKTAALDIGSDVHSQIEHYVKTGEDTLGVIARQGKHFIPEPGPGLLIEHEFGGGNTVQTFEYWRAIEEAGEATSEQGKTWYAKNIPPSTLAAHNVPLVGFIDLVNRRDHWINTDGVPIPMPPKSVEVADWKTSSNIELYGKRDLANTVQMIGYAEWARRQWPDLEYFRLSHGYFQTKGRAAEKRTVLISLDTVQEKWKGIEEQVKRMTQVARETDVNRIEPNYESCNAYGRLGCPHKEVCPRDPQKTLIDLLGGSVAMNMLDMLNSIGTSATSTNGAAAPVSQVPVPQAPATQAISSAGPNMFEMMQAMQGAPSAPSVPVVVPSPAPPSAAGVEAAKATLIAAEGGVRSLRVPLQHGAILRHRERGYRVRMLSENGLWFFQNVNSNDGTFSAPSGTTPDVWGADTWEDVTSFGSVVPPDAPASSPETNALPIPPGTALSAPVAAAAAAHAQAAAQATQAVPTTSTEETAKKTRKKKSEVEASSPGVTTAASEAPLFVSGGPLLLFVDCSARLPGVEVTDLDVYVAHVCAALAKAAGLEDIRLGSPENVLGYNKWKGALAAAVRAAPPSGPCAIRVEGDEIKQIVLATLLPLAVGGVVRGVR